MSVKARAYFYRQLATLLDAGIPIRATLASLAEQSSGVLRRAALALEQAIAEGSSLAGALESEPLLPCFSLLEREMLAAGEQSGRLVDNARVLAGLFEFRKALLGGLAASLAYPVVLIHVAVLLLGVPLFFSAGPRALAVHLLSAFGALYGAALLGYLLYRLARVWSGLGLALETLLLALPALGRIHKKTLTARFARGLSGLYQAGLPLSRSLEIAVRATASPTLLRRLLPGAGRLAAGETLSDVLAGCGFFERPLLAMVATGETSGKLDQTLEKAAEHADDEAKNGLKILAALLPVAVFLVVAAVIAYQVISFWFGYFDKLGI